MIDKIIKCQHCDEEVPELTYYAEHIVGKQCKGMNIERLNMYIVSEQWDGNKHSIHLSNTSDFQDQECETVVVLRPRMIIK